MTALLSLFSAIVGIPVFINGIGLAFNSAYNIGTLLTIFFGLALILISIFMKLIKKLFIYPLFKLLCTLAGFVCLLALVSSAFLYIYGNADTVTYDESYVVVLGCGLNGSEPSEMLVKRLDKAVEYAEENTQATIIVSGGQGTGEDITEAEAMYIYLTQKGIAQSRIIKEQNATSTTENFMFSNDITDGALQDSAAVFITNDFHIYRANSLARIQGLALNHLSADTPWHSVISSYLRENLALIQMIMFNR